MLVRSAIALSVLSAALIAAPGASAQPKHHEHHPTARAAKPQAERITHGPVVEGTGNSWVVIAWTTNTGGSSVVRYGTAPGALNRTAQAPYADNEKTSAQNHRVRLTGLRPRSTYFFEVVSGQGEGTGSQDARRGEFHTK